MALGYEMLRGRLGAAGYWRESGGKIQVQARGLKPGETCVLYAWTEDAPRECDRRQADRNGRAALQAESGSGMLFAAVDGGLRLWQGGEEACLRAGDWLRQEKEKREAPPVNAAPPQEAEPALRRALEEIQAPPEAEETPPPTQAEKAPADAPYTLRAPGTGEPADALPALRWPEEFRPLAAYFSRFMPCAPFYAPGWRFVRAPSDQREIPFLVVGCRAQDAQVKEIVFAVPGSRFSPPVSLPGYRFEPGLDGYDYWALERRAAN